MPSTRHLLSIPIALGALLVVGGAWLWWASEDSDSAEADPPADVQIDNSDSADEEAPIDDLRRGVDELRQLDTRPWRDDFRRALADSQPSEDSASRPAPEPTVQPLTREQVRAFSERQPLHWGEFVPGVHRRLPTAEAKVALTLDACDAGFDEEMIDFLIEKEIPATLFVTGWWIRTNEERLIELANHDLFEIANHGLRHRPCSVEGREIMGIEGTANVEEAAHEIEANARLIEDLTGDRPRFYRSGTAHYDEVCVEIAEALHHQVMGYDVVGDHGASFDASQVEAALMEVSSASIVILHANKPRGHSAEGLQRALPRLLDDGYQFHQLSDFDFVEATPHHSRDSTGDSP